MDVDTAAIAVARCARPIMWQVTLAGMRDAQQMALKLPNVGYSTNADHGAGCNIHPPPKELMLVLEARLASELVVSIV